MIIDNFLNVLLDNPVGFRPLSQTESKQARRKERQKEGKTEGRKDRRKERWKEE